MNWVYLTLAIIGEVVGTSALKASEGFSKLLPSLLCAITFALAFYFLALAFRSIPVGVAYAIWSGIGIVLISIIGFFFFKQTLDLPALVGIGFILIGVIIINTLSDSVSH